MNTNVHLELMLKRVFDLTAAFLGLVLLSPLLAVIALATKLESPRHPVFFNDLVMGQGQCKFRMFKFRTMIPYRIDYANRPEVRSGNPLVTRVGAVLRRLKLDELPQLWNVLRGDMSLVGPRPMDPVRFERASEFQRQRLLMRPGLTGWAQVNGNTRWSWEDRMEMDVWYIAHWSLGLDLRILLATLPVVLGGERPKGNVGRISDHDYRIQRPSQALVHSEQVADRTHETHLDKG